MVNVTNSINNKGFITTISNTTSSLSVDVPTTVNSSFTVSGSITMSGSLNLSNGVLFYTSSSNGSVTLTERNQFILFMDATSGSFNVTLPSAAAMSGTSLYLKRVDETTNDITIVASGNQLIELNNELVLAARTSIQIANFNSNWWII